MSMKTPSPASRHSRRVFFITGLGAMAFGLSAQDPGDPLADLLQGAQQWAQENLHEDANALLRGLAEGSPAKVQAAVAALEKGFGGDQVLDVAKLRSVAEAVLPILGRFDETAPYVPWLRTRLDYFDAADAWAATKPGGSVTVTVPSAPTAPPKAPPTRQPTTNPPSSRVAAAPPNPPAATQRSIWGRLFARRPAPAGAEAMAARLKPVFASVGAPRDLVWLAEIESSFNPEARSPAGAVGLFQLMPQTARGLGLSTSLPDERKDPDKSARAAARHLVGLRQRMGDWRLALASYNAGEGRIRSLLQRHKARTFDAIAPRLPAETQFYVPKFEAVLRRREGKGIEQLAP